MDPADSPEEHLHDTLVAGVGLCDVEAVTALVTEGPQRVRELVALGAEFDRDSDGRDPADPRGRSPPGPDRPRRRRRHRPRDQPRADRGAAAASSHDPGIQVVEHALVVDLLQAERPTSGGYAASRSTSSARARSTGSAPRTPGPSSSRPAGSASSTPRRPTPRSRPATGWPSRCARARFADLEFVQFHPTVLWLGEAANGQQPLISEAVRGEGACLVDARRRAGSCRASTRWPTWRRATSWRARSSARMRDTGTDHVYLDARHLGREFLERRFPSIVASLREHGLRPRRRPRPGRAGPALRQRRGPASTCTAGPPWTASTRAARPRAPACTAPTGWPSNSLLEGLVFAHRIADDITARFAAGELVPTLRGPTGETALARGRAPPRRPARDDGRQRCRPVGRVPGRSGRTSWPRWPRPPSPTAPTPSPPPGRRRTCSTSARSSPPWPPCGRRPAAAT